jgi:AraC-like DNA-binding protein
MPEPLSDAANRVGRLLVEPGMVRVGPILAVPTVLRSLAVEPTAVLAEFGLAESFFDDPENTLSTAMAGRLIGRCVECTGCEHFGLLLGQHASASSLGALGYLAQSSSTVGEALTVLARNFEVQDQGGAVLVEVEGDRAILGYTVLGTEVESLDQIMACAIAIATNLLRSFFGPPWRPDQVLFAFARPRKLAPYQRFFGVVPNFDMERAGVVFHSRQLGAPTYSADLLLHKLMAERVRELKQGSVNDIAGQVRRLLRTMVMSSNCSLDAVAVQVGMQRRTLSRKLAIAGTTFRELQKDASQEVACQLLENTRMPVTDIAATLRYAEPAAFTRAFQRWSGLTPTQWRTSRRRI